jgi:hypothetical protein
MKCEACRWWGAERAHKPDEPYGRCRALPPKIGEGELKLVNRDGSRPVVGRGQWPWTAFDDWCSAFAPREQEISPDHEGARP